MSQLNFWSIKFLSLDWGQVYNFDPKINDAMVFAVVANPYIAIFRPIGANSIFGQFYFLSLDLGRVYIFDLEIDDAIVFAVVANPFIAIFRPIGDNSIFGQF